MPNLHRGEIEANFDGRPHTLCLTLGALAELEAAFGDDDMLALAKRFEAGRLSARDCIRIIGAGLRGAGLSITDDEVAGLRADGGAAAYVTIVAQLLRATFGAADATGARAHHSSPARNPGERADAGPFVPGPPIRPPNPATGDKAQSPAPAIPSPGPT